MSKGFSVLNKIVKSSTFGYSTRVPITYDGIILIIFHCMFWADYLSIFIIISIEKYLPEF